ncbi:MAG: hypothetical protein LVS60_04765 [Nodosilinea sp. LVE1205-7]
MQFNINDGFAVRDLRQRYGLARSAVYKRLGQMGIVPQRFGRQSFLTLTELTLMDDLDIFIKQGGTAMEFLRRRGLL